MSDPSWQLHPAFNALCNRQDMKPLVRTGRLFRRARRPVSSRCPVNSAVVTRELDARVDRLIADRGLPTGSTGGPPPMLWCLGGPTVLRTPDPEVIDADTCVDLNVYVCSDHRIMTADLWPYDLAEWAAGRSPEESGRTAPRELAPGWPDALDQFTAMLAAMLADVLAD